MIPLGESWGITEYSTRALFIMMVDNLKFEKYGSEGGIMVRIGARNPIKCIGGKIDS